MLHYSLHGYVKHTNHDDDDDDDKEEGVRCAGFRRLAGN